MSTRINLSLSLSLSLSLFLSLSPFWEIDMYVIKLPHKLLGPGWDDVTARHQDKYKNNVNIA